MHKAIKTYLLNTQMKNWCINDWWARAPHIHIRNVRLTNAFVQVNVLHLTFFPALHCTSSPPDTLYQRLSKCKQPQRREAPLKAANSILGNYVCAMRICLEHQQRLNLQQLLTEDSAKCLLLTVRGFPGPAKCEPDCLERLWLISHYLRPLIHHRVASSDTKQALQRKA